MISISPLSIVSALKCGNTPNIPHLSEPFLRCKIKMCIAVDFHFHFKLLKNTRNMIYAVYSEYAGLARTNSSSVNSLQSYTK